MINRTYTMDDNTLKKLDEYARSLSISKSAALRILINKYCKTGED